MNQISINTTMNWMMDAHEGQYRMDGRPYCVHPLSVYTTISKYSQDDGVLKAALLHDVIEDCDHDFNSINGVFGIRVAELVRDLTNDPDRIKLMGKPAYMADKIKNMNDEALLIKLADRLDNVSDMALLSDSFVKGYVEETLRIVGTLFTERSRFTEGHMHLLKRIVSTLPSGKRAGGS